MLLTPSFYPDYYYQFQELLWKVADTLRIPLEEVQDSQHQLLDILYALVPARVALLIDDAILQQAHTVWHTLATCASTPKEAEKWYCVPLKGSEFRFSHRPPNSLVTQAATEWAREQHLCCTLIEKEGKKLGFLRWKGLFLSQSLVLHLELPGTDG